MRQRTILLTLAAAALFLTACEPGSATKEEGPTNAANAGDEVIIPVEGMVCVACVSRVNRTLSRMEGVDSAEADLAQRRVRVTFDPQATTEDEIVAAIQELGYKPGEPRQEEVLE